MQVPYLEGGHYLCDGVIRKWDGPSAKVRSPILNQNSDEPNIMGKHLLLKIKSGDIDV